MSIHCGQDTVFSSSIPSMGMVQSRKTPAYGAFVVTALLEPGIPRRMSPGKYLQLYTRGVPGIPLKPNREENDSSREPVPCLRHQGKFHRRDSYLPLLPQHSRRVPLGSLQRACPPVSWSFLLCACAILCSSQLSLLSGRSAKLVPRELFSMKLKISISLCLLLETWSLLWQKGR